MDIKPSELLRKNEKAYKDLKVKQNNYTENEIINLMIKNPNLIQRPIIEKGDKVILARPTERAKEIL